MKKTKSYVLWVGRFLAAISIFALLHNIWEFGLSSLIEPIIKFWRTYITQSLQFIFSLIGIDIPILIADILTVYIFGATAYYRSVSDGHTKTESSQNDSLFDININIDDLKTAIIWPFHIGMLLYFVMSIIFKLGLRVLGPGGNPAASLFAYVIEKFVIELIASTLCLLFIFAINFLYL